MYFCLLLINTGTYVTDPSTIFIPRVNINIGQIFLINYYETQETLEFCLIHRSVLYNCISEMEK